MIWIETLRWIKISGQLTEWGWGVNMTCHKVVSRANLSWDSCSWRRQMSLADVTDPETRWMRSEEGGTAGQSWTEKGKRSLFISCCYFSSPSLVPCFVVAALNQFLRMYVFNWLSVAADKKDAIHLFFPPVIALALSPPYQSDFNWI